MLAPATAQVLEDHGDVAEDDERRGKDRPLVEGHDQLVTLELPHLIGDGLHLEERVAVVKENVHRQIKTGRIIIQSDQLFSCGLDGREDEHECGS